MKRRLTGITASARIYEALHFTKKRRAFICYILISLNNNEHAVFSDEKYKEAHKIFKKMERHERYLIERDKKHGTVKFSYENDLSYFGHKGVDVFDDIDQEIHKKYEESMLKDALTSFQQLNPEGYDIISKYYLNTPAMTMEEIAAEYNLSKPAIHLRIKKYLNELRNLMDSYLSQEKNSENTSKTT